MNWVVWLGVVLTVLGVILLGICIRKAAGLRKAQKTEQDIRAAMQRLVALNMGALALSGLGLMVVVVGLVFA